MKTKDKTYDGEIEVDWNDLILPITPRVQLFDEQGYLIIQSEEKNGNNS